MSRLSCFTLGFLLLTVRAEKDDFQGSLTEQTKGTVTDNVPLKKENASGRGTGTFPAEDARQHRAVAATAKFPEAVLFDPRPTEPDKTRQITKPSAVGASASSERFVSTNGQNSLSPWRQRPSARFESLIPLISPDEKISFPSTQTALESVMNGASEPRVHLSADVDVPPRLRTLPGNRNHSITDSVTLTAADGGPGAPLPSASHPRVIDNLTVPRNDNDDKRYQGRGTSGPGSSASLSAATRSISQSDTAEHSTRANTLAKLCLTCLTDGVSAKKSLTGQSPHGSLGLSQLTNRFSGLHQESAGGREETRNEDISHQNIARLIEARRDVHHRTLVPSSFQMPLSNRRGVLNNPQIESFSSDTYSVAEFSVATRKESERARHQSSGEGFVRERPVSTTVLYHLSRPLNTLTKPVKSGGPELSREKVRIWESVSKRVYFHQRNTAAFQSHTVNFKHLENQTDLSRDQGSNKSEIAETPGSNQNKGRDLTAPSHPAAPTSPIEPQRALMSLSRSNPATSVKQSAQENTQFQSVTAETASLIPAVRSETSAQPSSPARQNTFTLRASKSTVSVASGMTMRHKTDEPASQQFASARSIGTELVANATGLMRGAVPRRPQKATLTAARGTPLRSRTDPGDRASTLRSAALSSTSLCGTPAELSPRRSFEVVSDDHEPLNRWPESKEDVAVISNPQTFYNKKQEKEFPRPTVNKDDDMKTRVMVKTDKSVEDETSHTKRGDVCLHQVESGKPDGTLGTESVTNQSGEEDEANPNGPPGGEATQELILTSLREDDTTKGKGPGRQSMTGMYQKRFTKSDCEKQRECVMKVKARPGGQETSSEDKIKRRREDMTNVRNGATANWREHDKGRVVTAPPSPHSSLQRLGAAEDRGVHLAENATQIVAKTTASFFSQMRSNPRIPHSSLRPSQMSPSKKPHTQKKPRPSSQRRRSEGRRDKVVQSLFSTTAAPKHPAGSGSTSTRKPTTFRFGTEWAPTAIKREGGVSLNAPAAFLKALPRFTVNTSPLNESIIHSFPDHKHESTADSALHATNAREEVEFIMSSVNPALEGQIYNDWSTKVPLSSEGLLSKGQLQPPPGQSAPQTGPSSSLGMTLGQPCSFHLSERAANPHALHVPVDDHKQRSEPTLMASMSPAAKNHQFHLSGVSPRLTLRRLGGDTLPGNQSLTAGRKSATDKKIPRAVFDAEYANSASVRAESLLGSADETHPAERTAGTAARLSVTAKAKQTEENNSLSLISKPPGGSENHFTVASPHLEQLAREDRNEKKRNNPMAVDSESEAGSAETTTLGNNHVSTPVTSAVQTLQTRDADFLHVTNDTAMPVVDTNTPIGTTAYVESDSLPAISKVVMTNNAALDMKLQQQAERDKSHSPKLFSKQPILTLDSPGSAEQEMNATSKHLATTTETNNVVSVAPPQASGGPAESGAGRESPRTIAGRDATGKPAVLPASHFGFFSGRGFPRTAAGHKPTPAVKRESTEEAQSAIQSEYEVSAHAANAAVLRDIDDPQQQVLQDLFRSVHRGEGEYAPTSILIQKLKYYSLKDGQTAASTESALKTNTTRIQIKQQIEKELPGKAIGQLITGPVTYWSPPIRIRGTGVAKKPGCKTNGGAQSEMTSRATAAAAEATNTRLTGGDHSSTGSSHATKPENDRSSSDCPPDETPLQSNDLQDAAFSQATLESELDHTSIDDALANQAAGHWTPDGAHLTSTTTQRLLHEAAATEVTSSQPEAGPGRLAAEQPASAGQNSKTQLKPGEGSAQTFEEQNASRSARASARGETAGPESGHRLSLPQPESERRRTTLSRLYLPGVTEVSDDLCGSGNYTAEMSVGRGVEPGDAVPAAGNLRVFINLKTNNSQMNLAVSGCCLSPDSQPDLANSTCCLFSRLAAPPAGITLLPSASSTSASFAISLLQRINYSAVYLHCDLSVCLRNHSDCERRCLQRRASFSSQDFVANIRNRISFGPVLKQVMNSTFPEDREPDLVLVLVGLAVGSSLVTVMLLLAWLAYRRRGIWPRRSAARRGPGGDQIQP